MKEILIKRIVRRIFDFSIYSLLSDMTELTGIGKRTPDWVRYDFYALLDEERKMEVQLILSRLIILNFKDTLNLLMHSNNTKSFVIKGEEQITLTEILGIEEVTNQMLYGKEGWLYKYSIELRKHPELRKRLLLN